MGVFPNKIKGTWRIEAISEGHHVIKGLCTKSIILSVNCTIKAKKLFTVGEELILPAANNISCEFLRKAAAQDVTHVPFSACTKLDKSVKQERTLRRHCQKEVISHCGTQYRLMSPHTIQVDVDHKATMFSPSLFFRIICPRIRDVHFCGHLAS